MGGSYFNFLSRVFWVGLGWGKLFRFFIGVGWVWVVWALVVGLGWLRAAFAYGMEALGYRWVKEGIALHWAAFGIDVRVLNFDGLRVLGRKTMILTPYALWYL
jgi:hypothetical protein